MELPWRSPICAACGTMAGVLAASLAPMGSNTVNTVPKHDGPGQAAAYHGPQLIGAAGPPALARRAAIDPGQDPEADESAVRVDWENERVTLPLELLDKFAMDGFTSESQAPWAEGTEAFLISEDLRELLQLEKSHTERIQKILTDARDSYMSPQWGSPTTIREEGDTVVMEIDPASGDLEGSIRDSLESMIGERRAAFLMKRVAPTLDWEFGGFGRARRVVEVSVLSDDTISLRESLRAISGGPDERFTGQREAQVDKEFELRTRQYRVERLPDQIAALVVVEAVN